MKFPTAGREDSDDLFAHTRMSFGDHIEELRMRLIRAILGFLAALVIGMFLRQPVLEVIQAPVQRQLEEFYDKRISDMNTKLDQDAKTRAENGDTAPFAVGE